MERKKRDLWELLELMDDYVVAREEKGMAEYTEFSIQEQEADRPHHRGEDTCSSLSSKGCVRASIFEPYLRGTDDSSQTDKATEPLSGTHFRPVERRFMDPTKILKCCRRLPT
jgi:hypothetical protein